METFKKSSKYKGISQIIDDENQSVDFAQAEKLQ